MRPIFLKSSSPTAIKRRLKEEARRRYRNLKVL
jgi:hypothetical protein